MARMYPLLTDAQLRELPSMAESTVYQCLRSCLNDKHAVIQGKSYVAPRKNGGHMDGEIDFIIFSADYGLLTLEVKGGGVTYDPTAGWKSIDKAGITHNIKDPIAQAKNQKYVIMNQLKANQAWSKMSRRISFGHAVIFPDIESTAAIKLPEYPEAIVGGKAALRDISGWLSGVFQFWQGDGCVPLGIDGLRVVEQVLCSPIDVRPLLRDILDYDNKIRVRLTNEQASVLRILARHQRAAIVGPAGTGKTILAMEKARILASEGADVLLLCYNRALGAMLSQQFKAHERVLACTFHQFCHYCSKLSIRSALQDPLIKAKLEAPNDDYYDVQLPLAAYFAIETIGDDLQYDAIVIDEGQDFGEEYWLPIEMALRSIEDSSLYIFYDENQRLYSRVSTFPIPEHNTYLLTKNCRNAKPIHDLAYSYYEGELAADSGIDGLSPIKIESNSIQAQAKEITKLVIKLVVEERVEPESIAILIAGNQKELHYNLLKSEILPRRIKWSREEHFLTNCILMDTVLRFKGLERDLIILWINQHAVINDALMYVGSSRAKSILYIVGDKDSIKTLKLV